MAHALVLDRIEKRFPGVHALRGVDLALEQGEVHALVGQNGVGKSTLVRILSGAERPDGGTITQAGRSVRFRSPIEAADLGIALLAQELVGLLALSIAENVCLGRLPRGRFGVDERALRDHARTALARVGLDVDVRRPLGDSSPAVQQLVQLARSLDRGTSVLLLDEPTAALGEVESRRLVELVRQLRSQGLAIVWIGHRMTEVLAVADRITVLRDGERVGTFARSDVDETRLVELMLGRGVQTVRRTVERMSESRVVVLSASNLGCKGVFEPLDLTIARGEVLGIAGLLGSGRSELLQLLAGVLRRTIGSVTIGGRLLRAGSVRAALARGVALVPEERKRDGLFATLSVRENIALGFARRSGLRSRRREDARVHALAARLSIDPAVLDREARTLSGGNQQKVLLARVLADEPAVLLLDEPTRGIDPGAKSETLSFVRELGRGGIAVALVSSELDEIVAISDRALVLRERRKVREIGGGTLTREALVAAMAGSSSS